MVGIFCKESEVIIVGLNDDGTPIDKTLFGPDSGRDIKDFLLSKVDFSTGASAEINAPSLRVLV